MSERETGAFEVPPDETGAVPVEYTRVEPRYFGVAPHVLVLALGAVAVGAAIATLATGHLVLGLVLAVVGVLAVALFLEQARRRRASLFEIALADGVDRVRAISGFAAASAATWSRAGRELARVRLEMRRVEHTRARLHYELGRAVHAGDEAERERLLSQLHELDERLEACAERARGAVAEASSRVHRERLAVAETQIVRPEDRQR
jgi:hypothetical protein